MARDGGLRKKFKNNLDDLYWVPVETWAVSGPGIYDSWYQAPNGASGWAEYKKHDYRVSIEQGVFGNRVRRMGGRAYVAIVVGSGRTAQLRVYDGLVAPDLAKGGTYAAEPVYVGEGGSARWDWGAIKNILMR
jgi:hypothetical protein